MKVQAGLKYNIEHRTDEMRKKDTQFFKILRAFFTVSILPYFFDTKMSTHNQLNMVPKYGTEAFSTVLILPYSVLVSNSVSSSTFSLFSIVAGLIDL